MRWIWIVPVILIMILPEAAGVAVAAETATPATPPSSQAFGNLEGPLLILAGIVMVYLAALGRRAKRGHPKRVSNAPVFSQQRN